MLVEANSPLCLHIKQSNAITRNIQATITGDNGAYCAFTTLDFLF
jgi:hypothetical protein